MTDLNSEYVRKVRGLVTVAAQWIGDECYGHPELAVVVNKSLEARDGGRDSICAARQHSIHVETDSKRRLSNVHHTHSSSDQSVTDFWTILPYMDKNKSC